MTQKMNFTKGALEALTCPASKADILVYDTEEKGLAIRVTKAGGKTFYAIRKINGKDTRIKIERFNAKTTKLPAVREQARHIYTNLESLLEQKASKSRQDQITLKRAFEDMLSANNKITKSTVDDYIKSFKHLAVYADRPLASITNDDAIQIHRDITKPIERKNGKISAPRNRTANKVVSLLGCIFGFAIVYYNSNGKQLFAHNPVDIMHKLKLWHENPRSKIRINPKELPDFINGCLEISDSEPLRDVETTFKPASAAILFMLFSGVRPGEAAKIRKEYVNHETRSIVFPKRTPYNEDDTLKNGKEFHLVLNDSAYCQVLYAMKYSTSDYVFSGVHKEKLSESSSRDFLLKLSERNGKHLQRKIMRASFISLAQSISIGEFHIKILCNHDGQGQQVDVTDGYKTAYLNEVREATVKVEEAIYRHSGANKDLVCRGLLSAIKPLNTDILSVASVSI